MSTTTTTPDTTAPVPDGTAAVLDRRTVETAPSQMIAEGPTFARLVGFMGLFALVLGLVVIITNEALSPRWISKGWGYIFTVVGLAMMLYHAIRDDEQEIRRVYGMLAAALLILAIGASVVPGPVFTSAAKKEPGYNLLPYGVAFGLLSLLFAMPFVRHETNRQYQTAATQAMLVVGGLLTLGSIIAGLLLPDFLLGPGIALGLLGLAFLSAYLGQVDTSEGIGYQVAFALGAVGAAITLYAIARAAVPTLLYEGPNALRRPNGSLDIWSVSGRLLAILAFAGIAALAAKPRIPMWLRSTLAGIGLAGVAILVLAAFKANTLPSPPQVFLVPNGMILLGLGIIYLAVALGVCSDSQFITLTRRELAAYFLSPIGYLVLGGMFIVQWYGYKDFYDKLAMVGRSQTAIPEPVVQYYLFALVPVICSVLPVPALTMRLLAEEKRTGSLEVLLTAPVNEAPIVLSKFLATWIFFMICWLPAGLLMIPLRLEGGQPFDYRPLLSFYVALAACSAGFIAIGTFFSAMTRNQIVAAVLTFMVMMGLMVTYWLKSQTTGFGPAVQAFLGRISYIDLWFESLRGQLPLRDVLVWVSVAVFFLFLSVKVVEARKWT